MTISPPASLLSVLASVPDPRAARGRRHPLAAMLAAVCCAVLCGARGFKPIAQWVHNQDIALMHALGFTRTPPKWGAFRKLLIDVDPIAFERAIAHWAESLNATLPNPESTGLEPLALDGKVVRGSVGPHAGAVHLLSVMAQRTGLTLAQGRVDEATNEHKAALELLRGMVLRGRVVTGDAMFCQRDLCQQIRDDGGHYLLVVKPNQPELLRDLSETFTQAADAAFSPSAAGPDRSAVHRAPDRGEAWRPGRAAAVAGDRPAQ